MARAKFDWDVLNAILQYGSSLADASDIIGVSEDTIERRIKKQYKLKFAEYRQKKMSKTRYKLRQKQIEVAMSGNVTMLIWLGKNLLDQADKQEIDTNINEIKINISKEDAKL